MFKLMDKKIITILRKLFLLNWPYVRALCMLMVELTQIKRNWSVNELVSNISYKLVCVYSKDSNQSDQS